MHLHHERDQGGMKRRCSHSHEILELEPLTRTEVWQEHVSAIPHVHASLLVRVLRQPKDHTGRIKRVPVVTRSVVYHGPLLVSLGVRGDRNTSVIRIR